MGITCTILEIRSKELSTLAVHQTQRRKVMNGFVSRNLKVLFLFTMYFFLFSLSFVVRSKKL